MLMKYRDLLSLAKEKVNEALAPLRAREMHKKAELEICKLDSAITSQEQSIQEIASKYPINFDELAEAIDEVDLLMRRKEQFEKIVVDLFEDEKK